MNVNMLVAWMKVLILHSFILYCNISCLICIMPVWLICIKGAFVKSIDVANSYSFRGSVAFTVSHQMWTLLGIFLLAIHKLYYW